MRRDDARIERLRRNPLFASCSAKELALVSSNITEHRAVDGDVLIREGGSAREFIVIVEGAADVLVGGRIVATLGPGDFAGELALLDPGPRTASVVATTDLVAAISTPREFATLVAGIPDMANKLLAGLARRMRAADLQLTS